MSRSLLCFAALVLAACGQAGPLYLPDAESGAAESGAADPQAAQPPTTTPPTQEPSQKAPLGAEPQPEPRAEPKKE